MLEERELNRVLAVSTASLGLIIAGSVLYAPLTLLSIPGIAYALYPFVQRGYYAIVHERKANMAVVDLIVLPGMLLGGFFLAAALGTTLFFWSRKLLARTEEQSRQSLVNVFGEQPQSVCILIDGTEIEIPLKHSKSVIRWSSMPVR